MYLGTDTGIVKIISAYFVHRKKIQNTFQGLAFENGFSYLSLEAKQVKLNERLLDLE